MAVNQVQTTSTVYGAGGAEELLRRKPQSFWDMALRSLRRDKLTIVALSFLLIISILSLGAGAISSTLGVDPYATAPANAFAPPYLWPYLQWLSGADPITARPCYTSRVVYRTGSAPTNWGATSCHACSTVGASA